MFASMTFITKLGCQSMPHHFRHTARALYFPFVLGDHMPRKDVSAATDPQRRLLPDGSMSCTRCERVCHLVQQCISDVPRHCLGVHHVIDGHEDRLVRIIAQSSSLRGPVELEAPFVQTMFFEQRVGISFDERRISGFAIYDSNFHHK